MPVIGKCRGEWVRKPTFTNTFIICFYHLTRASTGNEYLESLHLRNCSMVTDGDLKSLVYHNRGLTELDLSGCTGVTDVGIEEVAKWYNGSLRLLDLSGIPHLTSRWVVMM